MSAKRFGLRRGEGTIEPRQRADGSTSFRARWQEQDRRGKRVWRSQTFGSEDAARAHLITVAGARRAGIARPGPTTVADAIADYLERGARRWRGATVATYRQRARGHILPHLGKVRLDRLTTMQVQRWVDRLDADGLDASTVQAVHSVLSGALREAVRLGRVERNAATGVRLPASSGHRGAAWTADEARRVLAVTVDQPRWNALYQLVLTTGLRPGEARALRWEDVDEQRARLRVRRTVAHAADGGYEVRAGTKTGPERIVPLTLPVIAALRTWRQQTAGPYIFSDGFTPLRQHIWTDMHKRLCARAGVPVIRLHDLRHSCAGLLIEAGIPMKIVSEILGHHSITTTMDVYVHPGDEAMRSAVERLAGALNEPICPPDVPMKQETAS